VIVMAWLDHQPTTTGAVNAIVGGVRYSTRPGQRVGLRSSSPTAPQASKPARRRRWRGDRPVRPGHEVFELQGAPPFRPVHAPAPPL
jgi:hypothetical protein